MIKLKDTHKSLLILLVVVFSFAFITKVIAIANPYAPGATKNPDCGPTDLNCTVDIRNNLYKENANSAVTNTTTGTDSVAIGKNNNVTANNAIAIGQGDGVESRGAEASGDYSLALGSNSTASALGASALGYSSTAQGVYSTAIGAGSNAYSYKEVSIGSKPTDYTPTSATSWSEDDRLFNVGNGDRSGSDALTILKNGNVGIGESSPAYVLDINSTGAIHLPSGTTEQQPNADDAGLLRYNRDNDALEYADSEGGWNSIGGGGSYNFYAEGNTPIGYIAPATGKNLASVAIGQGASTDSFGQVTLGLYSSAIMDGSPVNWSASDPILVVGNGQNIGSRSNALVLLKNGRLGLGINPQDNHSTNLIDTSNGASLSAAGAWVSASDQALKENIQDLSYGLREVNEMQPRSFDYKIDGSPSIGFVAQEMEQIVPEVVTGIDGHKGIAYGEITAVLVNAVQELSDRVDQLEAQQGSSSGTVYYNNDNDGSSSDDSSSDSNSSSTTSSTPPVVDGNSSSSDNGGNTSSTPPGQVLGASVIKSSNDINATNALLFTGIILLIVNLIISLKEPLKKKKR